MKILITGSLGLVGSAAAHFYIDKGCFVIGVDNDMRRHFFGEEASGIKNMINHGHYLHCGKDISQIEGLIENHRPDVIIHCAAQPSHDWAATNPIADYTVNAIGTLLLLEMARKYVPNCVFVYASTNKVYGDWPNRFEYEELETRYEPLDPDIKNGFNEMTPIDQCTHSLFGVSKLSGDLLVQEYGKYFGMKTGAFRCGCITGAAHAGAEQHGFLSYLVRCKKEKRKYKVYGYKGKQVRDNIHANDLVNAFDHFVRSPRPGEVYNMGGGRHSNISVREALERMKMDYQYIDKPRMGDHQFYISDVSKFKRDYPGWDYKYGIDEIFEDLLIGKGK